MADEKISQLPVLGSLSSNDVLPVVDSGTTQQIAVSAIDTRYTKVRTTTYVVAASNAQDTTHADYFCTGTADQNTIQSAINALPASGGKIYLTEGTYQLNGSISLPYGSITIEGSGWSSYLNVANNTNTPIIAFSPAGGQTMEGVMLRNFTINANGGNQTSGNTIYAKGAIWCRFENLHIITPYDYGIQLYTDNIGDYGHHNTIMGCVFELGTASAGPGIALFCNQSDENMIVNNTFQANGRGGTSPYHIYDTAGLQSIIGNQFVTGGMALKVQGNNTKIVNNTFDGCGGTDLFNSEACQIHLTGGQCLVSGNYFYNIGYGGTTNNSVGLLIDAQPSNSMITNNVFTPFNNTGNARAGIDLDTYSPTYSNILNNIFTTANAGTATWGSAAITNGGTTQVIRNNEGFVTDNKGTGTVASGGTLGTITHGLSYTPTLSDIYVTPQTSLGSSSQYWVASPSSTTFIINANTNPGQNILFSWKVYR